MLCSNASSGFSGGADINVFSWCNCGCEYSSSRLQFSLDFILSSANESVIEYIVSVVKTGAILGVKKLCHLPSQSSEN